MAIHVTRLRSFAAPSLILSPTKCSLGFYATRKWSLIKTNGNGASRHLCQGITLAPAPDRCSVKDERRQRSLSLRRKSDGEQTLISNGQRATWNPLTGVRRSAQDANIAKCGKDYGAVAAMEIRIMPTARFHPMNMCLHYR